MRKVFIAFVFLGGVLSANAASISLFNCHAEACLEVGAWEDAGLLQSLAEAEAVYDGAYQACINGN
ncbi:hypothetical protein [Ascidiimonas aurantiaca]|uniref:hypothetical protein n=1 Tax=Ascidiimonas aurantiaca TaxID=1685432 RepID=UPI0030EE35CD